MQAALFWLQQRNPAYSDICISQERLQMLPLDGEVRDIQTLEYTGDAVHANDKGPAPDQIDPGNVPAESNSSVILPDHTLDVRQQIEDLVHDIVENPGEVTQDKRGTVIIPWPTQGNDPISEFTTKYFFTLAFPCLFPFASGDFHMNRPQTCESLPKWADHLLWYKDGRFAHHAYFKFIVHNMIVRKRALQNSSFILQQQLGDGHVTVEDLKEKLIAGDTSYLKKILYFGASLRGTSQYWNQRSKELRALIQYKIYEGSGLPSFFTTGSCAEFHFKPLRRLLALYHHQCTGEVLDLNDRTALFKCLQANTHIVSHYFDLRTTSYFQEVMQKLFKVNTYWYRMEFAKSRGMIHWHGLCWRDDREPHSLLYKAVQEGLSDESCADRLAKWAQNEFQMTAMHPAGNYENGNPRKDLWPPPEGNAPAPPEEKNPLVKLLMDVSSSQSELLEDYLLLTNRFNIHRCSDYCLVPPKSKKESVSEKVCRLEFGKTSTPGKKIQSCPSLVRDRNGSLRLEMARDHPMLVQHSRFHTQGWRANGDISLILSKSNPDNPSVNEILATEKYITGYACKSSQPTGAVGDLFKDLVNATDEATNTSVKSVVSKVLMNTVKRDVSAVETAHELSSLPLYRSSHTFQSVPMTGARVLERNGSTATKNSIFDKYLSRDHDDEISLYGYISRQGKVPVVSGSFTQPTWPLDEVYCRSKLLLHWPSWHDVSDIKDEETSWVDCFSKFLQSDHCPNFLKAEVERSKTKENREEEAEAIDDDAELPDQPEWMELIRPNAVYDIHCEDFEYDDGGPDYDWSYSSVALPEGNGSDWVEHLNEISMTENPILDIPDVSLNSMNADQNLAFQIVMKFLKDYREDSHEFQPLRLILAGTAGSGKSYLIKCIVKAVRTLFRSNKAATVLCPTGNSANLINGVTIHSFLKVPTSNKTCELKMPDGFTAEGLQRNCSGVEVILVDERSLIGANTLGWMEFLCRCGMQNGSQFEKSWGGVPIVIFLGDDIQLPPVLDSTVYNCKSTSPASLHGALVWKEFQNVITLHTIIRQSRDEQQLRSVLTSLRNSEVTSEQARWLQKFQWDDLRKSHGQDLLDRMAEHGLFVFSNNSEVWIHNRNKLLQLNHLHPITKLKAISKGHHAKGSDNHKGGGLLEELYLCKNAKVTLSVNLCVPYGLFNGAQGVVQDIIYLKGKMPSDGLPDVVLVKFPGYTGPPFLCDHPKLIPLVPVERKIECFCNFCRRTQIPLKLGWASTIHRCQGMTIGANEINRYIVIHPGSKMFESRTPGALFVALSRAKSAGETSSEPDFAWHPSLLLNEDRICHVVNTPTTKARGSEIRRIEDLDTSTRTKYGSLSSDKELQQFIDNIFRNKPVIEE